MRKLQAMKQRPNRDEWQRAWAATKLAVRQYSKDTTDANAASVKSACRRLRDLSIIEPPSRPVADGKKAGDKAAFAS